MGQVYAKAILLRAWQDAWRVVIAHSVLDLIKKIVVGAIVLVLLFFYNREHPLSTALQGQELLVGLTVEAIFITFGGLFVLNLLFVAPYQLWKKEREGRILSETGQSQEFHDGWGRATAPERQSPFVEAIQKDFTERNLEAMRKAREPTRDVSLSEGLAYILSGRWGEEIKTAVSEAPNEYSRIAGEAVQRASDDKITVWGRPSEGSPLEKIPSSHWREYNLNHLTVGYGTPRTENRKFSMSSDDGIYCELMICKREFEKEWPHA